MNDGPTQVSIEVPVGDGDYLHVRRIHTGEGAAPVLMLHGAIANGSVFYAADNRGLGPFLARRGYDVFVVDLRGKGLSRPLIGKDSHYGQTEAITEDIPAVTAFIESIHGSRRQHWVAHSWGGVLLASHLARFPKNIERVASLAFFGSKRVIHGIHPKKFLWMTLGWNILGRFLVMRYGFLPTREIGLGIDNETRKTWEHIRSWIKPSYPWVDPDDGFRYGDAALKLGFPPTLHLAGSADVYLGNPNDVRAFIKEMGPTKTKFELLGRSSGYRNNYDHRSMLIHDDAPLDHFPLVADWLDEHR